MYVCMSYLMHSVLRCADSVYYHSIVTCVHVCMYVVPNALYMDFAYVIRKVLPDGLKLRGDINILLMGDPVHTYIRTYVRT